MRTDEQRLVDILLSVKAVTRFTDGVTFETFMTQDLVQSAVFHQLEVNEWDAKCAFA
jgi:uncharacterized protein with HEPN domain